MTQTVPDISPLMPMHQDPLLVNWLWCNHCSVFKTAHDCVRETPSVCCDSVEECVSYIININHICLARSSEAIILTLVDKRALGFKWIRISTTCAILGWGVTSWRFPRSRRHISTFSELAKYGVPTEYQVHIWQLLPRLTAGCRYDNPWCHQWLGVMTTCVVWVVTVLYLVICSSCIGGNRHIIYINYLLQWAIRHDVFLSEID